jgi:hypothetical protein
LSCFACAMNPSYVLRNKSGVNAVFLEKRIPLAER